MATELAFVSLLTHRHGCDEAWRVLVGAARLDLLLNGPFGMTAGRTLPADPIDPLLRAAPFAIA